MIGRIGNHHQGVLELTGVSVRLVHLAPHLAHLAHLVQLTLGSGADVASSARGVVPLRPVSTVPIPGVYFSFGVVFASACGFAESGEV